MWQRVFWQPLVCNYTDRVCIHIPLSSGGKFWVAQPRHPGYFRLHNVWHRWVYHHNVSPLIGANFSFNLLQFHQLFRNFQMKSFLTTPTAGPVVSVCIITWSCTCKMIQPWEKWMPSSRMEIGPKCNQSEKSALIKTRWMTQLIAYDQYTYLYTLVQEILVLYFV